MVTLHAVCALLSLAPMLVLSVPPIWTQPEQVHLSYPGQCMNCLYRLHVFSFRGCYFSPREYKLQVQVVWIADLQMFCADHSIM